MSVKQTRVSLKGLSDEEKKERKKIQMKEYMNKRRKQEPEFAQKQRELCVNRMKVLRENPEFVQKEREYFRNYQRNLKNEYRELKKSLNIAKI
jgi:hypothetical protein